MIIRGQKIRESRKERGLSLIGLSQRTGISVSYLSEIERGAKKPSLKTIEKIAAALNVPKIQLLEIEGDEQSISLGEKLRLLRETRGKTLGKFAEEAGISVSYLSEIERGNVYPAVHTLKKMAERLEVPLSSLVGKGGPLGSKLKVAREEQGLTQGELARAAGVSPGLIGQIEHGKVQPSLKTIEKLSEVLGTSPCYFIKDDIGIDDMMSQMSPALRDMLANPNVQAVLRLVCNCTSEELKFILNFIKLYKCSGSTAGGETREEGNAGVKEKSGDIGLPGEKQV